MTRRWFPLVLSVLVFAGRAWSATYYVTVAGLGGEPDYEQRFAAAARDLDKAFRAAGGATPHVITLAGKDATAERVRSALAGVAREAGPADDLVLVLIGHGSLDGAEYKFNLVGPDLTAAEIAAMCDRVPARRQLVVDTTSASGGAIAALQRTGRAVIAATKSGTEKNATVFARYLVEAVQDPAADTDKNDSVTALEVFTYANRKTTAFYDSQKRLATEHAVFTDVARGEAVRAAGGGQGQLLGNFTILRMGAAGKAASTPERQALLAKKEELEQKIDVLKYGKAAMDPAQYRRELTAALLELAQVQEDLDQ